MTAHDKPDSLLPADPNSVSDMDSVVLQGREMVFAEGLGKAAGLGMADIEPDFEEVRAGYEGKGLRFGVVDRMAVETVVVVVVDAAVVGDAVVMHRLLGSKLMVSNRLKVDFVGCEKGILAVGRPWGWRRRMWRALAGCRRLIEDGGCRGLKSVEAHCLMVHGCGDRSAGIEVAVAVSWVPEWHMRMVERYFEADIGVSEFVILLSMLVEAKSMEERSSLPDGAPSGPGV